MHPVAGQRLLAGVGGSATHEAPWRQCREDPGGLWTATGCGAE